MWFLVEVLFFVWWFICDGYVFVLIFYCLNILLEVFDFFYRKVICVNRKCFVESGFIMFKWLMGFVFEVVCLDFGVVVVFMKFWVLDWEIVISSVFVVGILVGGIVVLFLVYLFENLLIICWFDVVFGLGFVIV